MSYEDDVVWRAHLDLYTTPAEPLPITKVTDKFVYTETWSGETLHADGRVEKIGTRTVVALNRAELESRHRVVRGRVIYSLDNPDNDLDGDCE